MSRKITFIVWARIFGLNKTDKVIGELITADNYQLGVYGNRNDGYNVVELSTGALVAGSGCVGCHSHLKKDIIAEAIAKMKRPDVDFCIGQAIDKMRANGIPYPLNPPIPCRKVRVTIEEVKP